MGCRELRPAARGGGRLRAAPVRPRRTARRAFVPRRARRPRPPSACGQERAVRGHRRFRRDPLAQRCSAPDRRVRRGRHPAGHRDDDHALECRRAARRLVRTRLAATFRSGRLRRRRTVQEARSAGLPSRAGTDRHRGRGHDRDRGLAQRRAGGARGGTADPAGAQRLLSRCRLLRRDGVVRRPRFARHLARRRGRAGRSRCVASHRRARGTRQPSAMAAAAK